MNRLVQVSGSPVQIEKTIAPLYYLACPYSDPEWEVQEERYLIATEVAAALLNRGHAIFSPVTHSFPLSQAKRKLRGLLPRETTTYTSYLEWEALDKTILQMSVCMLIVAILGWSRSRGVANELQYANSHGIPVEFIIPSYVGVTIPIHHECTGAEKQTAFADRSKRVGFQEETRCPVNPQ